MGIEFDTGEFSGGLNEFFVELNEASARMDNLMSRIESVFEEGTMEMNKRKEDIGMVVLIIAEGLRRGQEEDLEAVAQAVATLYLVGFYDGKQKGENQ